MYFINSKKKAVIGAAFMLLILIIKLPIKQAPSNYPIAKFKSLNEVIDTDTCVIYNQFRPINAGAYPEYEQITPSLLVHSKFLFHGSPKHWVKRTSEWKAFWKNQLNGFPHFLFSGRLVFEGSTEENELLYEHWKAFGFVVNVSSLISVHDVHLCKSFLSFYPVEKYDSNIKETHNFFSKMYLPSFNVPLVENTSSYPLMLKCAELDGADEGVFYIFNETRHLNILKENNCSNWIQQEFINPNPFSTVDVNFFIHRNKSISFIGASPEIYLEVGSINSVKDSEFWMTHFYDIIHKISLHITTVSNYWGFICFDAVRTSNGEWRVVDINVRLCGGHHHFMIANTMRDRKFVYWQYLDNLSTKQGITCDEFMLIVDHKNKQLLCKCVIGSMIWRDDSCTPRIMLFGTTKENLSKCFPFGTFNMKAFDPRELIVDSDSKVMNEMMPRYLIQEFYE